MKHTKWKDYVDGVLSGEIVAGRKIRLAVERFEKMRGRDDIWFDEETVDKAIDFISIIHHFLGASAGKPFILEPWQEWMVAYILGIKWKESGYRVIRDVYFQVGRKAGKTGIAAAIALYMLIADGEAAPEIACLANSREQARLVFKYITNFSMDIDKKGRILKCLRNYIDCPANKGTCKVYSADASKLDGLNVSCGIVDEYHEAKSRALYDVIKSSMTMRKQPLMIVLTTAGFNLESPCHDMYMLGVEILEGVKEDDSFLPIIFDLDEEDDWKDEKNWTKCQPNLGVTVTYEAMRAEVVKAKNDATAVTGVLTKTFNKWVSSSMSWIPGETIAKCMGQTIDLHKWAGTEIVIGADLGAVSDFCSISACWCLDDKYYFKSWTYIPEETYKNSPRKELYDKFIREGTMFITPGKCTDYDYVTAKINEINNICPVQAIYTDKWNATQWINDLKTIGYNVEEYSQSIFHFSSPTKEMERLIKENRAVISRSQNVLWQFGNVILKSDANGNIKPIKGGEQGMTNGAKRMKIDSVISMITALGGLQENNVQSDWLIL